MNAFRILTCIISISLTSQQVHGTSDLLFTNIPYTQHTPVKIGTYDQAETGIQPGVLIRNGFGKFSTGPIGKPHEFNHLFDSLSLILKFNFTSAGDVYYQSRMQPSAYYNQSLNAVPLYRTLGGFTPNFTTEEAIQTLEHTMHDNLNANIIPVGHAYMAISDLQGGNLLDPETLHYVGNVSQDSPIQTPSGWLEYNYITSTHPLSHPDTPHIVYNYDAVIRVHTMDPLAIQYEYRFYTWDSRDELDQNKTVFYTLPTPRLAYVHSFSLTGGYLIFFEYPMFWDIPAMSDHTHILPTIHWDPSVDTLIQMIDIRTGTLAMQLSTEPFFAFHHINSFYLNQTFTVDILTYPNGSIFSDFYLSELRRGGPHTATYPAGRAVRFSWRFDSTRASGRILSTRASGRILSTRASGRILSTRASGRMPARVSLRILTDRQMELPTIDPLDRGRPYRYFYAVGNDYAIYRVDVQTGELRGWSAMGHYPSEPVYIPPGYLASVTLDSGRNRSYLLLLDANRMEPALTTTSNNILWLDTWIPLTCHGNWVSSLLL
jgi:beta-carotene 15,15'-monooxygenase